MIHFKSLFASLFLLAAGVAQAGHLVLPVNVITDLPSCGGTVETSRNNGSVNLVFRKVKDCSNFDILSTAFGILDADYKAKKIPQDSTGLRTGSFTIPKIYIDRGINAIRVVVKSNSGAHSDTIDLVFVSGPNPIPHPIPHPIPVQPGNLRGYCSDSDYSQFKAAKSFAYSPSGLNLSDTAATEWALDYNRTHRCYTIEEYKARFTELKQYAYSPSYLNKSDSEAVRFALEHAEQVTVNEAREWKANFSLIQQFFYSPSYLNRSSQVAAERSDQWVRRFCGGANEISNLKSEYSKHYSFAYSPSGLNYSSERAAQYAVSKISYLTHCSDLLR
jgi:hypothetical protein